MANSKPKLNIGLIGTGFMGKTHTFGFAAANRVFDLPYDLVLRAVADRTDELAAAAGAEFGFETSTGDWRSIIDDASIDVVDITTPNALHKEMALAAIAAGKHVYCEKPLAPLAADAIEMAEAAEAAGIRTQVGFNYLCNPIMILAREMIQSGELGEIRSFRGVHAEEFMADASNPGGFRVDPAGGGAFADIGSHALATAEYLLGPITAVMGDFVTAIKERPDGKGGTRQIEVDDIGRAFLRFENGASGNIEASWIATGQEMQHDFEIYGSKGAILFTQERLNELRYYNASDPEGRRGFRTILAGPEHPPYGRFCVAGGHQLGFNDLKAIEVQGFVQAIAGERPEPFNFRAGARIMTVIEAIATSSKARAWMEL
ncbi:Gfo/Idh/MocA family protein [Amaricoccus sp. W119]|uniref:Gfo/Idh/MocA family protein n=1 Tax=Amaricoccus sp. W119 TaxID=3391833 RepID=UPI0039A6820F